MCSPYVNMAMHGVRECEVSEWAIEVSELQLHMVGAAAGTMLRQQ